MRILLVTSVATAVIGATLLSTPMVSEFRADHWKTKGFNACMAAKTNRATRSVRYCQQHS